MILIAMLLQAAAPTPDLGRQVAETGPLVRLLPIIAAKEADELVKAHPDLSPAAQAVLRENARTIADATRAKLVAAMAPAYARALTPAQMQAIIAFEASDAAKARHAAELPAMMAGASILSGFDFKGEVMKSVCAKTGKGCAAPAR